MPLRLYRWISFDRADLFGSSVVGRDYQNQILSLGGKVHDFSKRRTISRTVSK